MDKGCVQEGRRCRRGMMDKEECTRGEAMQPVPHPGRHCEVGCLKDDFGVGCLSHRRMLEEFERDNTRSGRAGGEAMGVMPGVMLSDELDIKRMGERCGTSGVWEWSQATWHKWSVGMVTGDVA